MLEFKKADLFTHPSSCVIAHICNNVGLFGAGFALAIAQKHPSVQQAYTERHQQEPFDLGEVQFVEVGNLFFANMIAQNGVRSFRNPRPIKYNSLEFCLMEVYSFAKNKELPVVMPRIGAGLAGGDWQVIEKIIRDTATTKTFIYEL